MTDDPQALVASDTPAMAAAWHAVSATRVLDELHVSPQTGLDPADVAERLAQTGPNRLTAAKRESVWGTVLEEVREPMILLLLGTGVLYGIWGGIADALTIFAIIAVVVGVEVINERRAESALDALRQLAAPTVLVRRGGQVVEVSAEGTVPGDVLILGEGQRVPADARLLSSAGLAADESPLTGESAPVDKDAQAVVDVGAALAERTTMVYAGTTLMRGQGEAVVVATGLATEMGHIARLTAGIKEPRTPLQITMRELTRWMIWLALGFSTLVPLLGWLLGHQPPQQMVLTGLSLAFATIPEELPILITIVLALGAYRLAQRHAIVRRLRAAETLSAVSVIATDKTGTLTTNHMHVQQVVPTEHRQRVLEIGVLCNAAVSTDGEYLGDPMEVALLELAREEGWDVAARRKAFPNVAVFPFDTMRKMMAVAYAREGALWVAVKGAPERVLAQSTQRWSGETRSPMADGDCQALARQVDALTLAGLRVIAVAERVAPHGALTRDQAEADLTFVGFVGLADPPRPEVRGAIAACQKAGIRSVMITGDHPYTARAIAQEVGMAQDGGIVTGPELDGMSATEFTQVVARTSIYARATPAHKLRIVQALRAQGERVAVTGDGINDAPALAAADIGIAMGKRGTDVAREAAGIVLADDNFATITAAVREGRLLFANLRKAIRYYLACKVALVSATLLPVLLGVPVPLSPIQIIVTELFMDVAASATLVNERAEGDLMRQRPRDARAPFMNRGYVSSIFAAALGLFVAVSIAYLVTWYGGAGVAHAQTVAFVTWLLGHVLLALHLRSEREPLARLGVFSNRLMDVWLGAVVLVCIAIVYVPGVQSRLNTTVLTGSEWLLVVGMAVVGTSWIEVRKWLVAWRAGRSARPAGAHAG
ncbi:MAG TPA: cation-transporting P-type ATPase [Ktedonobacterales bacterium]